MTIEVPVAPADRHEAPADGSETEFWDAPWTFDDEWLPRTERRPDGRRTASGSTSRPSVFGLL